ncbi:MAG: hypothetical protein O7H41_08665 [Planctomycetota bacterium]|nr:hypothetical protein [Planctomycetota bacterium]
MRGAFWGCFTAALVVSLLSCLALAFGAKKFVNWGIASDLSEHIQLVTVTDIDRDQRIVLVMRLQELRERARRGEHVGFWRWLDHDELIRALLDDRVLTDDELELLSRELETLREH